MKWRFLVFRVCLRFIWLDSPQSYPKQNNGCSEEVFLRPHSFSRLCYSGLGKSPKFAKYVWHLLKYLTSIENICLVSDWLEPCGKAKDGLILVDVDLQEPSVIFSNNNNNALDLYFHIKSYGLPSFTDLIACSQWGLEKLTLELLA